MLRTTAQRLVLLLVAALVIVIGIQVLGKISPAHAADDPHNMRVLLESLKQKTEDDATFVTFQLNTPLTKGGDTWIEVPLYDKTDFVRDWYDIGDDYVCFNEHGGQSYVMRCTPFSNIAEVVYAPPV